MRKNTKHKKRIKTGIKYSVFALLSIYLVMCFSMRLSVRETSIAEEDCKIYYIVNVDGMKGLGHSIVLLVSKEGLGTVISFNGMQYSLIECLLGKSGVGKMSIKAMTKVETNAFLKTGNLNLDEDQLSDNYDIALYRPITIEEYNTVLEQTIPYLTAEEQFLLDYNNWALETDARKKEEYQQNLERLGQNTNLPLYQIYTNNCDHAARQLIGSVDLEMKAYSRHTWHLTPNGNLKAFGRKASNWGVVMLGTQSIQEELLKFLMIF